MVIRPALDTDVDSLLKIYAPYVAASSISFECELPSSEEFLQRIIKYQSRWQWLVAEIEGNIVGYAYGSPHRERSAYQWSADVSVYVSALSHGQGIGKKLYLHLLRDLANKGYRQAFAGIAQPNVKSVALHRSVGFELLGVYKSVGFKHGQWHDVAWYQLPLGVGSDMAPTAIL
ncbi:MAG: N-acetyltransferase [Burkholderiales bacterium]|nr:N-acetyltransferase [Burkholderiales bacterium]